MEVENSGAERLCREDAVSLSRCGHSYSFSWTIDDLDAIERPPVVDIDGDTSSKFVEKRCKVGETVNFDASQSYSPHGAKLSFKWYQYKEIGSVLPVVSGGNWACI